MPQPYRRGRRRHRGENAPPGSVLGPIAGWQPVVRGTLGLFGVDGDHDSIFDRDVGPVADIVNLVLREAQAKAGRTADAVILTAV